MSGRNGAVCIACQSPVSKEYIKAEALAGRMGANLMAVVAEGHRRRIYLEPTDAHAASASVERPDDTPDQELGYDPKNLWTPAYGLTRFSDLFTTRQLVALTTFSDLVGEARGRILIDALAAGHDEGERLDSGGAEASAYADAVATYLSLSISRLANKSTSVCSWDSSPKMEAVRGLFARQAIPMAWDYAEANPLGGSSGDFTEEIAWICRVLDRLPQSAPAARVTQADAARRSFESALVSTDPPYYDNIGYSDLSDFFYVWQRRTLKSVIPSVFQTMLVPKTEELVANPYRHDGRQGAKEFFEDGFREVFKRARETALHDFPITVYYAFKQSDTNDDGQASSGWETLLDGMVRNGWSITATWPLRSELSNRMIASGTNALASSIVLALRPRPEDAPTTDRRGFIAALKRELGEALRTLQTGGIAPVDLPQAAIGPGMAVFSRYVSVIESDGTPMTVRSALARINEILDEVLGEQEGDFDSTTRFAIAWYRAFGYQQGAFGDADNMARARNTAVSTMERDGILSSHGGKVRLFRPSDLSDTYDVAADTHTSAWEALHHTIRVVEGAGVPSAGTFLHQASQRLDGAVDLDLVKELAYLLFQVAEKNGWTKDALSFNSLATAWPDLMDAKRAPAMQLSDGMLDFGEND